jgi:dUTP pyrophosphatase
MSANPAGLAIRFKRWDDNSDLPVPAYATAGAAGFDLRAAVPADEPIVLRPGARCMAPTGFSVAIPDGYEMQVRPRSGLALRSRMPMTRASAKRCAARSRKTFRSSG